MYIKVPMIDGKAQFDYRQIDFIYIPEPPDFCFIKINNQLSCGTLNRLYDGEYEVVDDAVIDAILNDVK